MMDIGQSAGHDPGADAGPPWRERKNLMIAGAVGVAAVVGLLGYFVVFAGGSSSGGGGLVAGAHHNALGAVATTSAPATLPPVYQADPYGNPFKAIYAAAPTVAATGSVVVAPPVSSSTAGTGSSTGNGGVVVPPASTPTATPAPTRKPTTKTTTIKLISVVDADTVVVSVNGGASTSQDVNQVFGGVFSLMSTRVGENEATFKYGDGSPFTLIVGQTKKFVVTS